jgi:hypothetical protein
MERLRAALTSPRTVLKALERAARVNRRALRASAGRESETAGRSPWHSSHFLRCWTSHGRGHRGPRSFALGSVEAQPVLFPTKSPHMAGRPSEVMDSRHLKQRGVPPAAENGRFVNCSSGSFTASLLVSSSWTLSGTSSGIRLGSRDEPTDSDGIEIEHLRPREPSAADLIQAENRTIATVSAPTYSSLPPEDHDFLVGRRHNARIHRLFCRRGLQRDPRVCPAGRCAPSPRDTPA